MSLGGNTSWLLWVERFQGGADPIEVKYVSKYAKWYREMLEARANDQEKNFEDLTIEIGREPSEGPEPGMTDLLNEFAAKVDSYANYVSTESTAAPFFQGVEKHSLNFLNKVVVKTQPAIDWTDRTAKTLWRKI
jgi:hypothetical protein